MQRPLTIQQTIIASKEWAGWREVNNYPLSPYREAITDAEKTGYFTPKHWRAFVKFIEQVSAKKYEKLKIRVNNYAKEKTNGIN